MNEKKGFVGLIEVFIGADCPPEEAAEAQCAVLSNSRPVSVCYCFSKSVFG